MAEDDCPPITLWTGIARPSPGKAKAKARKTGKTLKESARTAARQGKKRAGEKVNVRSLEEKIEQLQKRLDVSNDTDEDLEEIPPLPSHLLPEHFKPKRDGPKKKPRRYDYYVSWDTEEAAELQQEDNLKPQPKGGQDLPRGSAAVESGQDLFVVERHGVDEVEDVTKYRASTRKRLVMLGEEDEDDIKILKTPKLKVLECKVCRQTFTDGAELYAHRNSQEHIEAVGALMGNTFQAKVTEIYSAKWRLCTGLESGLREAWSKASLFCCMLTTG
mmetsp:Transcript_1005/g.3550  ORF Transcript_1005/g.3550 Transcript_1005/m.3550 type:complete len:274 (-) Transcript_1005:566-1387(-)|eukprot:scaffold1883_cov396-Prasinococcus_capsulatus_cf.AAC.12